MNKLILSAVAGLGLLGLQAVANTVTWKGEGRVDDWNWNEAGNFEEGAVPGAGDTVVIPAGLTVYVKPTDADSRGIAAALKQIVPTAADSKLVIETAGPDDVYEFGSTMTSSTRPDPQNDTEDDSYKKGELVKRGEGELKLTNATRRGAYYTRLTIEAGALRMPYTPNTWGRMYYGQTTVAEGAKLIIGTANTQGYNYTEPRGLWGKGLITNECNHAQEIRTSCSSSEGGSVFEGTIGGPLRFVPYSRIFLTGTNSTFTGDSGVIGGSTVTRLGPAAPTGVLGFKKLGRKGQPSSLGKASTIGTDENGGALLYLGEGEVSDKDFRYRYSPVRSWIDGGAFGGLEMTGTFGSNMGKMVNELVLSGSNATPCVISGNFMAVDNNGTQHYLTKAGSGAWRLVHAGINDRKTLIGFSVLEGTLQFDSLRPSDEVCAFGMGTNRIARYYGPLSNAVAVAYNFALGSTNELGEVLEGTLEPVAGRKGGVTNAFTATDRPIALLGDGRIRMNAIDNGGGVERRLTMRGVTSIAPGLHTLTLDGTGSNDNSIADMTDGEVGQVAVVKEGSGTWVLSGTNSFSGGLTVKAGRLVLNNSKTYTWYRFVVKRINGGGQAHVAELGLFDKDGANQAKGITAEARYDASVLGPGKLGDGRLSIKTWAPQNLPKLFDNSITTGDSRFKMYSGADVTLRPADTNNGAPSPDKPATWYYIDFRLPEGANPVTSYDLVVPFDNIDPEVTQEGTNTDNKFKNVVRSWALWGSVDGIHWDSLHEIADAYDTTKEMHYADPGNKGFWLAAQTKFDSKETAHEGGVTIASGIATGFPMLSGSTVSVEPGAELVVVGDPLTIGKFRIGQGGGGTIRNAKFAAKGEFAVDGLDFSEGSVKLHGTYEDVEGLANIENWTPTEGGVASRRYVLSVNGSDVTVYKKGTLLIIR